ncbi:unnamed protein product [Pleuronectes platessa]|uniref:Secreted protein n=1 Tax=Pleuronectes platessa TaxID=8262 RepID=A0A9N7W380_PLEPL|nr:unnamed protein product [Pleuronectes platessa]
MHFSILVLLSVLWKVLAFPLTSIPSAEVRHTGASHVIQQHKTPKALISVVEDRGGHEPDHSELVAPAPELRLSNVVCVSRGSDHTRPLQSHTRSQMMSRIQLSRESKA